MLPLRFIASILLVTEASHHRNVVNAFWYLRAMKPLAVFHGRQFAGVTDRCVTGSALLSSLVAKSMRPVGTQSCFTIPLNSVLFLPLARLVISASGFSIARSLMSDPEYNIGVHFKGTQ